MESSLSELFKQICRFRANHDLSDKYNHHVGPTKFTKAHSGYVICDKTILFIGNYQK